VRHETATLAGGCFWCLEAVYDDIDGVISVESGYMGGHKPNPTYKEVCGGRTGHAEVIQMNFDADRISYGEILDVFFAIHDPTTRDRQGNDSGPQYRSAIFFHSDEQRKAAEEKIQELEREGVWSAPIVTEVKAATEFWRAEDYHQDYFRNNPNQPYCMFVVDPKVQKFRKRFGDRLKQHA
jgi:peptide-methionine (S)-S-oxide reductase